jgi:ATP-binding cassette, subfamily C (CFTR/MRP), member 1
MGVVLALAVAHLLALPFASPFASGSSPYGNGIPVSAQSSSIQVSPLLARPVAMTGEVSTIPDDAKRPPSLSRFFSSVSTSTSDLENTKWKSGEAKASLVSRLFFQYAKPLLTIASQRRLGADDVFEVPDDRQMHSVVTSLTRIYQHVKSSSSTKLRAAHKDPNTTDAQAAMLTKSLFWHQRHILVYTGLLRLLNTAVQAFPALLIARLLRLVEAGDAHSPHKALAAAVTLVVVLSLKMVLENQFFHQVVKSSTQVRGALAGLIFDKSLRLPSGEGNGVESAEKGDNAATLSTPLGAGAVLNLMQSDASIIESVAMQFHTLWDGPLQIAIYTALLFRYLGPSVWWGIAVLMTTIPINSVALSVLNRLAKYENQAKDARTKRTAESISNMKLLKLQGWEQLFANDIRGHRHEELRRHDSRGVVRALNSAISNAVPSMVLVVTLTAYVKAGKPIVASTIFTAISLFNQLRYPLFFYPMLVDSLANGRNAMRRIATYLSSEEIALYVQHLPLYDGGGSIELLSGNFLWSTSRGETSAAPALVNVQLKVNPGEIVAVVGSVGSGKSCLVKALLGELNPVPGMVLQQAISKTVDHDTGLPLDSPGNLFEKPAVITHGNVAYCSQEAWLAKGTIMDAIVFGREYDESRYRAAIRDAGLDRDISSSLNGENSKSAASGGVLSHDTNVGEGGSSLSGGQRARVALARALYSGDDTKVFLLDDCFAALDASVGEAVFERLSKRLRYSNAAAVLVSNDPSLPRRCDRVILMGNVPDSTSCSTILDVGTYDELISRGHDLLRISSVDDSGRGSLGSSTSVAHSAGNSRHVPPPWQTKIRGDKIQAKGGLETLYNSTDISCLMTDLECRDLECHDVTMEKCPDYVADLMVLAKPEIQEGDVLVDLYSTNSTLDGGVAEASHEARKSYISSAQPMSNKINSTDDYMSVGAVPLSTYISYFKSVRQPMLVIAMLACYLMSNGAQFYQQYTVAKWTEVGKGALAAALNLKFMRKLVQVAGVVSIFLWLRSFLTMKVGIRASENLHSQMLLSVFKAPMSFFDATPSGQLLSRFGKEMETIDRGLPDSIQSVLFCFLQIFMSIGALAAIVTPGMLVPVFVVGVFYGKAMTLFRPASRDLKRAETKTRSPIYTHFGEALRGTDTIRSVPGARQYWSEKHRSLSDSNLAVFYTLKVLDRWLSTRLETLGNTVVLAAAVLSVRMTRAGHLQAGSAGWGLTQSLAITGLLTWAVRCLTDLETNM